MELNKLKEDYENTFELVHGGHNIWNNKKAFNAENVWQWITDVLIPEVELEAKLKGAEGFAEYTIEFSKREKGASINLGDAIREYIQRERSK